MNKYLKYTLLVLLGLLLIPVLRVWSILASIAESYPAVPVRGPLSLSEYIHFRDYGSIAIPWAIIVGICVGMLLKTKSK